MVWKRLSFPFLATQSRGSRDDIVTAVANSAESNFGFSINGACFRLDVLGNNMLRSVFNEVSSLGGQANAWKVLIDCGRLTCMAVGMLETRVSR
jgi:hypothetical protein